MYRFPSLKHIYFIVPIILLSMQDGGRVCAAKGVDWITSSGPQFDTYDAIRAVQQDAWYTGQNALFQNGAVWLTPDPRDGKTSKAKNIGKVIYKDKVRFKYDDHGLVSFTTSFTFQILNTSPYPNCGSGMVFFIADYAKAPEGSYGRYFGLVSPNATNSYRFFAVEFDTHITEEFADPSASHMGIDINSLKSRTYANSSASPFYPHLYLYNNYTFTAWIEYDAQKSLIQVWMHNSTSSPRPPMPCLNFTYDLSTVFEDFMYVGFSASNNVSEDSMEGHALYAWNFTTYPPPRAKTTILSISLSLLAFFALCLCVIALSYMRRKKKHMVKPIYRPSGSSKGRYNGPCPDSLVQYSYKELKKACHKFAEGNKIGEGTFSFVYKGTVSNGEIVAIKRLKEGFRKEREFSAELEIISKLRHRNLLPLLGWCYDKGEALLVYPHMSKGNLSTYLYGELRGTLSSEVRLNILIGVASALEYLHRNLRDCVLHRDVKAGNVLLTDKFEPMLGDFGLARFVGHNDGSITMTAVGTPGYVAPEVVYTNKATDKSDVYSFGILALVVASGCPAVLRSTSMLQSDEVRLVDSVWTLHQHDQLIDALDCSMSAGLSEEEEDRWGCVLHVALMCSNPSPELRPTMRQVCQALQGDNVLLMEPLPPVRPIYPMSHDPDWPCASKSSERSRLLSLSVSHSEEGGFSNSSVGQNSASVSTASFDPSNENWVGR